MQISWNQGRFLFAATVLALLPASVVLAEKTMPGFNCSDDSEVCVFNNTHGTSTIKLTILPIATCDSTWRVEVYCPDSGTILQTERYTPGNDPIVTIPVGKKARLIDDNGVSMPTGGDDDGMGISGSKTIQPC